MIELLFAVLFAAGLLAYALHQAPPQQPKPEPSHEPRQAGVHFYPRRYVAHLEAREQSRRLLGLGEGVEVKS